MTVDLQTPGSAPDVVLPLEGLLVIDLSQFLSGPSAALRLADLGARVIKVERPGVGEVGRQLYISNQALDGDSTLFHAINRNKDGYSADLKDPAERDCVLRLVDQADVVIQNFRPGVAERLGLGFDDLLARNSRLVYGSVSGYGNEGPWVGKPGQDLLAQSMSGLPWLNGNDGQPPVPVGLAAADMLAGAHLVQGILACLVRRGVTGEGGLVEVSLLESILDLQFEVLTTHLNDGGKLPQRARVNSAHAYLGAPYGLYETLDGHLAIAMGSVIRLGELLGLPALQTYTDPAAWFDQRDEIKALLAEHLRVATTAHWLALLEPADVWCAEVLTWPRLLEHEGFKVLNWVQRVHRDAQVSLETTRCPIRVDGKIMTSPKGAPRVGQHDDEIRRDLLGGIT